MAADTLPPLDGSMANTAAEDDGLPLDMDSLRQEGGKRKKKAKKATLGGLGGAADIVKKGKGKAKVNREHMLLTKLEQQGEAYKKDGPTLMDLADIYAGTESWGQAIHFYKLALRAMPEKRIQLLATLAKCYHEHELYEEAQLAVDETAILLHLPLPSVRCINSDGERASAK